LKIPLFIRRRRLTFEVMKNLCLIVCCVCFFNIQAQEIGYLSGVSKLGINPSGFQPLYGFTIGTQLNKYIGIETALFYSQRSKGAEIQADYFSFMAMPKIGFFGKRAGVYYAPGIALNPTLHHSNIENHTYLSTFQSVGAQLNIRPRILVDLKVGYDIGLTGAYFENGGYSKYSGIMILAGIKIRFNKEVK
jgi:hypothetical protein